MHFRFLSSNVWSVPTHRSFQKPHLTQRLEGALFSSSLNFRLYCTWYTPFLLSFHLPKFSFYRLATALFSFKHFSHPLHAVYFLLFRIPPSCKMKTTHISRMCPTSRLVKLTNKTPVMRAVLTSSFDFTNPIDNELSCWANTTDKEHPQRVPITDLTNPRRTILQASATSTLPCRNQRQWLQNPVFCDVIPDGG